MVEKLKIYEVIKKLVENQKIILRLSVLSKRENVSLYFKKKNIKKSVTL